MAMTRALIYTYMAHSRDLSPPLAQVYVHTEGTNYPDALWNLGPYLLAVESNCIANNPFVSSLEARC